MRVHPDRERSGTARVATTTAGLRATQWNADDLPAGVKLTVHALTTVGWCQCYRLSVSPRRGARGRLRDASA